MLNVVAPNYREEVTTEPLAPTGRDGRHLYTCPLCEAMCGLQIRVDDGRFTGIRGFAWVRS